VLAKSPEPTDVDNCINTINLNKETEDREPEAKKTVRLLEKGPQTNSDIVTPAVAIKSFANQHKGNLSEKFTKSVVSTSSSVVENSNKDLSNVQAKSNTDPATDFVFLKLAYSEPDTGWTLLQRSGQDYFLLTQTLFVHKLVIFHRVLLWCPNGIISEKLPGSGKVCNNHYFY